MYPGSQHINIGPESPWHQPVERSHSVRGRRRETAYSADGFFLEAVFGPRSLSAGRQHKLRLSRRHWYLPTGRLCSFISAFFSMLVIISGSCHIKPHESTWKDCIHLRPHVRITSNQADTKYNANRRHTTKQHAVISSRLNVVACPTYPEKFVRGNIIASFLLLSVFIVSPPAAS